MAYSDKFNELEQLYSSPACCQINTLADDGLLITDAELEAWVKDIYTKGKGNIHIPTVQKVAQHLWQAVQTGYGINFSDVDLNSADATMLNHLYNNCYTFSAAKNRTHLQQLTSLINAGGKIREWPDYYQEALKLNLKLNKTWLKTEYDLALAGGTMASKFVSFSSTPDAMLKYTTVGDARVRDSHRVLDGITLPVSHPFWNNAYPPNGFKCRCDVDRIPYDIPATPNDKIPGTGNDIIPPMFQVNLAKNNLVFPPKHPYYTLETIAGKKVKNTGIDAPQYMPKNITRLEKKYDVVIDKEIFNYLNENIKLTNREGKTCYYSRRKEVNIDSGYWLFKESKKAVTDSIYHEFGHAIEVSNNFRTNQSVLDLMDKYRKLYSADGNKLYIQINARLKELNSQYFKSGEFDNLHLNGCVRDMLMALNKYYGSGHSLEYFSIPGKAEGEFLAHMFENVFGGNVIFQTELPELYNDTLILWENLKQLIK